MQNDIKTSQSQGEPASLWSTQSGGRPKIWRAPQDMYCASAAEGRLRGWRAPLGWRAPETNGHLSCSGAPLDWRAPQRLDGASEDGRRFKATGRRCFFDAADDGVARGVWAAADGAVCVWGGVYKLCSELPPVLLTCRRPYQAAAALQAAALRLAVPALHTYLCMYTGCPKFCNIHFSADAPVANANITPLAFHMLRVEDISAHPNQSQLLPRGMANLVWGVRCLTLCQSQKWRSPESEPCKKRYICVRSG